VVPANALVDLGGRRGVFMPLSDTAVFRAVQVGTEQGDIVEILGGLTEGNEVITTGAGQLRDGDRIVIAGGRGGRGRGGNGSGQGSDSASARPGGAGGTRPSRGGEFSGTRTAGQGRQGTVGTGNGRRSGGQFSGEGRQGQFGKGRAPGGSDGRQGTQSQTPTSSGAPVAQPATQP